MIPTIIVSSISLFIIAVSFYFLGRIKHREKKKGITQEINRKGLFTSFILTLFATLLGVLWAFNLSNIQVELNEKGVVQSLIGQSINELKLELAQLEGHPEFVLDRDEEDSIKMLNNNPQEDLVCVELLISNELFPKYCTQMGTMALVRLSRDKEKFRNGINNSEFELKNRILYMNVYKEYLQDIQSALVLEQDYLNGNISSLEVVQGLDGLRYWNTHDISK